MAADKFMNMTTVSMKIYKVLHPNFKIIKSEIIVSNEFQYNIERSYDQSSSPSLGNIVPECLEPLTLFRLRGGSDYENDLVLNIYVNNIFKEQVVMILCSFEEVTLLMKTKYSNETGIVIRKGKEVLLPNMALEAGEYDVYVTISGKSYS